MHSDPHQAPNTKGENRQIQLKQQQNYKCQAELATLSQKGGNPVTKKGKRTNQNSIDICYEPGITRKQ